MKRIESPPGSRLSSLKTAAFLYLIVGIVPARCAELFEEIFRFSDGREVIDMHALPGRGPLNLVVASNGLIYGMASSGLFKVSSSGGVTIINPNFRGSPMMEWIDGYFYGTTPDGGASNLGTIYKMSPSGQQETIVSFTGDNGSNPTTALIPGTDGCFYGTTNGGPNGHGTIFRMTPEGELTTLFTFSGSNGSAPGSLLCSDDGNYYGTTGRGGASGKGTVFKMTPGGTVTILVHFTGIAGNSKGSNPASGLMTASNGNIYGATKGGGSGDFGTLFKLTPAGALTTLVEFTGYEDNRLGEQPYGGLVEAPDGCLYGTTRTGGVRDLFSEGCGTLFKITLAGEFSTVHVFEAWDNGNTPAAPPVLGYDGNLYGTTEVNGGDPHAAATRRYGTVYKIKIQPGSRPTVLASFYGSFLTENSRNKGGNPRSRLLLASDGNFYGTTARGGSGWSGYGNGTVYKMTPEGEVTSFGLPQFGGGSGPGLVEGRDENFYGTTGGGDQYGVGTVFRMTPQGAFTTLLHFSGNGNTNKGAFPASDLLAGRDGNIYGTTAEGGLYDRGTAFKLSLEGVLETLVEFSGNEATNKGTRPLSLTESNDGYLYGITAGGGEGGQGTIFRMTKSGVLTTLVEFAGGPDDGASPVGLMQGRDGNFYGTTSYGGSYDSGTVFRMDSLGHLTIMADLDESPFAGLVQDVDGSFYGTATGEPWSPGGKVFRMAPDGTVTVIKDFSSNGWDFSIPFAGLTLRSPGELYGTLSGWEVPYDPDIDYIPSGGIFRITFPGPPIFYDCSLSGVERTKVRASGSVRARNPGTKVFLEYGTDGETFPNSRVLKTNLSGYVSWPVESLVEGLAPGTAYTFRFRSENNAGVTLSPKMPVMTLVEPALTISPASQVGTSSAHLNGTVNARNYDATLPDATVRFEWGTDGNNFPKSIAAVPPTVPGSSPVPVQATVADLAKGTQYFYRIVATNAGGTGVSGVVSFITPTEPVASIRSATALSTTRARVDGTVNARGSDTSASVEYGTDGFNFNSAPTVPGMISGVDDTAVYAELANLTQGKTYHYRIKAVSAGGTGYSPVQTFSMSILSGLNQTFPDSPAGALGTVSVTLQPGFIGAGWRFVGEQQWRPSGSIAGNLTGGDRLIEFRPVPGFIQPLPETVSIVSADGSVSLQRDYYSTPAGGAGGLTVTLKPDSLATAQWRMSGDNDTQWENSGATRSGLTPGTYIVECKPVSGRTTPPLSAVTVLNGPPAVRTLTYFLADAQSGAPPSVLPFSEVSSNEDRPYAYVGQLRSNSGFGTGFVAKRRVVATAAHVVWDDGTLSAATGLQWLFQRDRGTYEPKPLTPRGFYISTGYSDSRNPAKSPGVVPGEGTSQSQNLDYAALYFLEEAGRGGVGGYLASDAIENEFLISPALKLLAGYPVEGIDAALQGRMHATAPADVLFNIAFDKTYRTAGLRSTGGNSGGPLCVQHSNGKYYPAAIYLGGSAQTVVRAIDSSVVDLFLRAEASGNGGGNSTGGGITHTDVTGTLNLTQPGAVRVKIEPEAARSAGAGWRLRPEADWRATHPLGVILGSRTPGDYILQIRPLPGWAIPADEAVSISGGQTTIVTYTYGTLPPALESWRQEHFGTTTGNGDAADNADPDRDGLENLVEFGFGLNPNRSDAAMLPQWQRIGASYILSFTAPLSVGGITYVAEQSETLSAGSWSTIADSFDGRQHVFTLPATSTDRIFLRVRVTAP